MCTAYSEVPHKLFPRHTSARAGKWFIWACNNNSSAEWKIWGCGYRPTVSPKLNNVLCGSWLDLKALQVLCQLKMEVLKGLGKLHIIQNATCTAEISSGFRNLVQLQQHEWESVYRFSAQNTLENGYRTLSAVILGRRRANLKILKESVRKTHKKCMLKHTLHLI